ncbi:sugar kinase [Streptomyces sp. NPDC050619]|uniref:sugar kinase n=1 Tax=Streptomyces sp. NPDC050619 TaxID=3157214 RepID=UPI00341489AB
MSGTGRPDVVCVGETMAVLSPPDAGPLAGQRTLALTVGGAESNVACSLAALGHRVAWLSRVGADPLGHRVLDDLTARGVDVSAVESDPERPTGVYFKDPAPDMTRTYYYRRGSAASAMSPSLARLPLLHEARLLHLSGITPALSDSCAELMDVLLVQRAVPGPLVSFDVNHRPALWRHRPDAAQVLLGLARAADIVFVGRDEAETLWGTGKAEEVRDLLRPARVVVVKDADHGATAYTEDGAETFVAAPPSRIVERVGAGDAFAAGYLSTAVLEGGGPAQGLRHGHELAATALATRDDVPA